MSKASEYARVCRRARERPTGVKSIDGPRVGAWGQGHVTEAGEAHLCGCWTPKDIPLLIEWLQETFLD